MLDLKRLQMLAALEMEGTMTAAAARLHLSTSAVSQQIALLEREVGLPLLERVGRRVRLNEPGATLVEHYRHIAAAVESAETSLTRFHTDVRGRVVISTFPSFCSTILPQALMTLRRTYPELTTVVRDMEPVESVAQLRAGEVDVAVVDDLHQISSEGIVSTVLASDEIVVCMSQGYHPLPPATVDLRDLSEERWVFETEGSAFEGFTRGMCVESGFEPDVVANCNNLVAMLGLVRAGFGLSFISELNLGRPTEDLVVRRLDPIRRRDVLLLTRETSLTPAVRAVAKELRTATRARYSASSLRAAWAAEL